MPKLALPDEYLAFARIDRSKGCTDIRVCVRVSALPRSTVKLQATNASTAVHIIAIIMSCMVGITLSLCITI